MGTNHVFIVDVIQIEAPVGTLLDAIESYIATDFGDAPTTWIVRQDQATEMDSSKYRCHIALPGASPADLLGQCLSGVDDPEHGVTVAHILSYDATFLTTAAKLNSSSCVVVSTNIFIATGLKKPATVASTPSLVADTLLSERDVRTAKLVLYSLGHVDRPSAMKQVYFRPALIAADANFQKEKHPLGAFLVKRLVQHGLAHGWLHQEGAGTGLEALWLSAPAVTECQNLLRRSKESTPERSKGSSATDRPEELPNDVARMEAVINSAKIGSPVRCRNLLFGAIERLVHENREDGIVAASLLSMARVEGSIEAPRPNDPTGAKWGFISECFFRMLLEAEVLLDADDHAIPKLIGAYSARVFSIHPDFRLRAEAGLVKTLVKMIGKIPLGDLNVVARCIYHEGKLSEPIEVLRSRLDPLLQYLIDVDKSVYVDEDGNLRYRASVQAIDCIAPSENGHAAIVVEGKALASESN